MPLSPPAARTKLHTRTIVIDGYEREDGNFDVEAHLTDVKTYSFASDLRGQVQPGEPLHDMFVRLTFDDRMTIIAAEAVTETGPYAICGGGAASYANLVGLRIRPGFLREANARMAGPNGCTHLREMLQEIATTALQTMWPVRARRNKTETPEEAAAREQANHARDAARMLNTCHAYSGEREVVQQRWPHLYTGPVVPLREAQLEAGREAQLSGADARAV